MYDIYKVIGDKDVKTVTSSDGFKTIHHTLMKKDRLLLLVVLVCSFLQVIPQMIYGFSV
jgi:hypothetical protein